MEILCWNQAAWPTLIFVTGCFGVSLHHRKNHMVAQRKRIFWQGVMLLLKWGQFSNSHNYRPNLSKLCGFFERKRTLIDNQGARCLVRIRLRSDILVYTTKQTLNVLIYIVTYVDILIDIQKNINRLADKGRLSVFVVNVWEQKWSSLWTKIGEPPKISKSVHFLFLYLFIFNFLKTVCVSINLAVLNIHNALLFHNHLPFMIPLKCYFRVWPEDVAIVTCIKYFETPFQHSCFRQFQFLHH